MIVRLINTKYTCTENAEMCENEKLSSNSHDYINFMARVDSNIVFMKESQVNPIRQGYMTYLKRNLCCLAVLNQNC